MKIRNIIFWGLLISSMSAWAKPPDITGSYTCDWRDLKTNILYESTLLVSKLRVTYLFSWTSSNGKLYIGNGLFNSPDNTALAVMYNVLGDPKLEQGVQLYILNPDGSLSGPWASNDKVYKGASVCRKNRQ